MAIDGIVPPVSAMARDYTLDQLSFAVGGSSQPPAPASARAGYITAVVESGIPGRLAYTVNVGGVTVPGMLAATEQSIRVGDTVLITQLRQEWVIVGRPTVPDQDWTPKLWSGGNVPPPDPGGVYLGSGSATGKWRMIAPTLMWVAFRIVVGEDGSVGSTDPLQIGEFPHPCVYDQTVPLAIGAQGGPGSMRMPAVGSIGAGRSWIGRIFAGAVFGYSSGRYPDGGQPQPGLSITGSALLEVDPLS